MINNNFINITIKSYEQYIKSPYFEMKVGDRAEQLKSAVTTAIGLIKDYIKSNDDIFEISSEDSIKTLTERIVKFHKVPDDEISNVVRFLNKMFVSMNICIQTQNSVNSERSQKKSLLNDENIELFIKKVYTPMLGEDALGYDGQLCVSEILRTKPATFFITEFSIEKMEECFKKYGVVQLRELNKEAKTLVIGCGHDYIDLDIFPDIEYLENRITDNKEHSHAGQVTVDIDLMRNPDILANFGKAFLSPLFQGHKFEKVIFEGFAPEISKEICQDTLNLLKTNGKILICAGSEEEDFTSIFQEKASL